MSSESSSTHTQAQAEKVQAEKAQAGPTTPSPPPPPPNGGTRAWLQVLGAFFLNFNTWGLSNSFGIYQTEYSRTLLASSTQSQIAWIGSLQAFLMLCVSVLCGRALDAGYFYVDIGVGIFLQVFGMMMTSIATEYWQIMLAQGVVVGIGAGMNFIASVTVVGTYFSTKRSTAQGIAATGSCFGGIIYPVVIKQLLADGLSLAWSTRVVAFLMLATLLASAAVMRPRSDLPPRRSGPLFDADSLRDAPFAIWLVACFFTFIGLYIPFFYVEVDALSIGVSEDMSFYMLTIMNAASIPGRVVPAAIADRVGNLHIIIPAVLLSGVVALGWMRVNDEGSLIAVSVLFGLANGAINSVVPGAVAFLCPDLSKLGSNIGMTLFASGLGMLVGTPVAGAILGSGGGEKFWAAFCFTGVVVLAGGVLICVCRVLKVGFAITKA